jgi:hypothetical protein
MKVKAKIRVSYPDDNVSLVRIEAMMVTTMKMFESEKLPILTLHSGLRNKLA